MDHFALQILSTIFLPLTILISYVQRCRSRTPSPPASTPPSPPSLPIIGHLHLLTGMPHHSLAKLANKLGPIIYLKLGRVPTVVISSAQLAELVLRTHDDVFGDRPQLVSAQYLSFGSSDVTFSPTGPYWRQARKICMTELLSPRRVNSYRLVREQEMDRLVTNLSSRTGSEVNLSELLLELANDVLCRVAFGKRLVTESKHELGRVLTETQALNAGFCAGDFFPEMEWVNSVSGMKRRLEKNLKELREVCDKIISEHVDERERRGGESDVSKKEDFVDVLLRVQQREDLDVPITDDNIRAIILDMFVAGTDTSSSTIEWTMTQLARHPKAMKKAQEEVRRIAATKATVEDSDLQHLNYLKAAIKETMRLNPTLPLLVPRESMEDCTLNGYTIPAKTRVLVNTYAIGRDPQSWENPLEYRPERFLENNIDFRGPDYRFLPFGGGRRGCPGFAFGLATVEMALARMIYHFDWALPDGLGTDDLDLEEVFGLSVRKKSALVLVPKCPDQLGK